jgi:DNA-binding IclR family transcriptional regulator
MRQGKTGTKDGAEGKDARGIQSVEVGLGILFPFLSVPEPLKLREIADRAGVSPAQAHTYLVSYRRMGLVDQDEATGRYRLGKMALDLAIARMRSFDPLEAAGRMVEALRDLTGLTVSLSVFGGFGPTVVVMRDGLEHVYINTRVGTVYSISGTATGLAFAASMTEPDVKAAIALERGRHEGYRRVGVVRSWDTIQPELEIIRKHRYATISPNPVAGMSAIASPVIDHAGQVRMVITLIGTSSNPLMKTDSSAWEALMATTARMSFELGHMERD